METFIIREKTEEAARAELARRTGGRGTVMQTKFVKTAGFLGFGRRDEVELTCTPGPDLSKYANLLQKKAPHDMEEEKRKILAQRGVKNDPMMTEILKKIDNLSEKLEENHAVGGNSVPHEHENLGKVRKIMEQSDFSPHYIEKIIAEVKKEVPIDTLDHFDELQYTILRKIGQGISLFPSPEPAPPLVNGKKKPRLIALVGTTGVGKTTTVAKLAAHLRLGTFCGGVRQKGGIIYTDAYKISGGAQIKTYAELMGAPISKVESPEEMRREIAVLSDDCDVIIIDTIGRGPRESVDIAEMKSVLDAARGTEGNTRDLETHLVVPATVKYRDIVNVMGQFEPFGYRGVIVTKLDETGALGNVISAVSEKQKAFSWLTNGQKVPKDIMEAGVIPLLLNLDGFEIDRNRLDSEFGANFEC